MNYRELNTKDIHDWGELRTQLWPQESVDQHINEIKGMLKDSNLISFGAFEDETLIGLIEVSLRNIVDGCSSSPVVYLEGWVVHENHRKKGIGKELFEQAKNWGLKNGCTEMGSDTEITRSESIVVHKALGFEEVDRVVNFRMNL